MAYPVIPTRQGGCVVCGAVFPDPHDDQAHDAHVAYLADLAAQAAAAELARANLEDVPENEQRALWGDR